MTNGRFELRIFFIQENHTIAGWSNTPDAHFTQLWFEAPPASVIYLYISTQKTIGSATCVARSAVLLEITIVHIHVFQFWL